MNIYTVQMTPGATLTPGDRLAVDGDGLVRRAAPGEYWVGSVPEWWMLKQFGSIEPPVGSTFMVARVNGAAAL